MVTAYEVLKVPPPTIGGDKNVLRAYILDTGHRIYPFNDLVADLPVANERVADAQERVFGDMGFDVQRINDLSEIEADECVLTYDDVYFTYRVFRDFWKKVRKTGQSASLALPRSLFTEWTLHGTDVEHEPGEDGEIAAYRFHYLKGPGPWDEEQLKTLPRVVPKFKEKVIEGATPTRFIAEQYRFAATSCVVFHLRNWYHLYRANLQAVVFLWDELITRHKLWSLGRFLAALPGALRSGLGWSLAGKFNKKGRGCNIHPSAVVEFSILGDKVSIGAGAIVRGCILGNGANISDGSHLQYSVLGERCFTSKTTVHNAVVTFDDSDACAPIQLALIGRECALTVRSYALDMNMFGTVKIFDGEQVVDTGTSYLGACFGHRVRVGFNVVIGPGRAIPNDTVLVSDDANVLRRFPDDVPSGVPLVVRNGVPVPIDK